MFPSNLLMVKIFSVDTCNLDFSTFFSQIHYDLRVYAVYPWFFKKIWRVYGVYEVYPKITPLFISLLTIENSFTGPYFIYIIILLLFIGRNNQSVAIFINFIGLNWLRCKVRVAATATCVGIHNTARSNIRRTKFYKMLTYIPNISI